MIQFRILVIAMTALAAAVHAQSPAGKAPVPGAPAGVTAFVDVTVIPMDTERVLSNHTVLVEGGRITALGPVGQVQVPAQAVRLDGRGKYLMPGLADMHIHFSKFDSVSMANRLFGWLADGITTARSMDYTRTEKGEAALRMRELAAAGRIWSPRLYVSAPWAPRNPSYMRPAAGALPELDSVAAYVAEYKAKGYDHIKLYNEHGAVFDALVAAARRAGVSLEGHVPSQETLERVLAAGVRSIEHLTGYSEAVKAWAQKAGVTYNDSTRSEAIAAIAEATKRAGVWNCPTLALWVAMQPNATGAPLLVKALHEAGAGLLFCTDDDNPDTPRTIHAELKALVDAAKLTPYEALVTGTRNVAVFYGTSDESGTVAVGKRADLVLLNGNPLADVGHTARPAGVMIGGRWLARAEIDRRLAEMKAASTTSP